MTSKDALLKLLMDRPVAYHADLAKAVGSVTTGLFLSQMLYWLGKGNDPAGWIYKSQADLYQGWEGMSRKQPERFCGRQTCCKKNAGVSRPNFSLRLILMS
jgi:hypothetical protein